jgi:hypothetical protein
MFVSIGRFQQVTMTLTASGPGMLDTVQSAMIVSAMPSRTIASVGSVAIHAANRALPVRARPARQL